MPQNKTHCLNKPHLIRKIPQNYYLPYHIMFLFCIFILEAVKTCEFMRNRYFSNQSNLKTNSFPVNDMNRIDIHYVILNSLFVLSHDKLSLYVVYF